MSSDAKREYLRAIHARYQQASREEKGQILSEFCRVTGSHRKYAIRRLNGPPPEPGGRVRRHRPCTYGPAVIDALRTIWAAAGYPWSVRLKALLPLWLPWAQRRLRLSAPVVQQLGTISPRQGHQHVQAVCSRCHRRRAIERGEWATKRK